MAQQALKFQQGHIPALPAELDTRVLFGSIWAKRFLVVVPTFIAFFVTYVLVNMITPRYSSESRVFVENRESVYARSLNERQQSESLPLDQEAIASHVQLMYSRDLAREVVQKLKLNKLSEFDSGAGARSILTLPLTILGLAKDRSRMTAEERTLDSYYERLTIYPVDRSRVIEIKFQSQDPDIAAKVANAIAEKYLELQLQAKLEKDRKASQHVQNKIENLRNDVEEAEAKVQVFRAQNDLFLGDNNQTLTAQQLTELNTQLTAAQTQQVEAATKASTIRELLKSGRTIEVNDILNSPLIQRMVEQRSTIRGEIATQMTVLLPGHPKMRELQAQHADIEMQIRNEAEKLARSLESDSKSTTTVAEARLASIKQGLKDAKKTSTDAGDREVTMRALEREAKAQRDLLEAWLGMYREAMARDSLEARNADARIVSMAAPSNSPAFPKKGPIIIIATLATLLIMIMIVFTGELASGRAFVLPLVDAVAVETAQAVPAPSGLAARMNNPSAIPIPEPLPMPNIGVTTGFTLEPREENAILSDILYKLLSPEADDGETQVVLVAGATSAVQEGQFTLKLGRALIQAKRRAVVVDVNAPRPQLSLIATGYSGKGLSELMAGKAPFASVIYRDVTSRLNIIPYGSANRDLPRRSYTRPSFGKCIKALSATYDFVLMSGPAIVETEDTTDLASIADRVVVMAYEGMPEDLIIKARDAFLAAGAAAVDVAVFVNNGQYAARGKAQLVDA